MMLMKKQILEKTIEAAQGPPQPFLCSFVFAF
jgi:hypothetical protein